MSSSSCLQLPAKRVWRCLRACLGLRRTRTTTTTAGLGLGQLRKEVRNCEYSDIHVMWDMLSSTGVGVRDGRRQRRPTTTSSGGGKGCGGIGPGRVGRKLAAWSRLASYCCALDLNSDVSLV